MGMHTCRVLNLADPGQRIEGMINGRKVRVNHGEVTKLSDTVIKSLRSSVQTKWNENVTAYTEMPSYDIQIIEDDASIRDGEVDTNRRASAKSVEESEVKRDVPVESSEVSEVEEAEAEMMADLEEE